MAAKCSDCGRQVFYADGNVHPWVDEYGNTECVQARSSMFPGHRVVREDAEKLWREFYEATGTPPRHDVNRTYALP